MGISSTETDLGLKKILEEKGITFSSGNTTNLSLRGLSIDGTSVQSADYFDEASQQYVNVNGTPNADAPYGIGEFRGYSHIAYTFNMRGSNSAEPSIAVEAKASSTNSSPTAIVAGSTDAYMYAYYKSNGNIGITGVSAHSFSGTSFGNYRRWFSNSGTQYNLTGNSQMPEPGIEIANVSSGYTVRFEVDENSNLGTAGQGFSVIGYGTGSFSNSSGDTYTHSGTVSLPTQTSSQASNDTHPNTAGVRARCLAATNPADDIYFVSLQKLPAFRLIFEKSGSPSFTIYTKAKLISHASNTF